MSTVRPAVPRRVRAGRRLFFAAFVLYLLAGFSVDQRPAQAIALALVGLVLFIAAIVLSPDGTIDGLFEAVAAHEPLDWRKDQA